MPHGKFTGAPFNHHMILGYRNSVIGIFKIGFKSSFPILDKGGGFSGKKSPDKYFNINYLTSGVRVSDAGY